MDESRLELRTMIEGARARAALASARLGDRLTERLHQTPDERLARLMRSRVRRAILEGIFWQMPQQLDRRRAVGVDAGVLWRIAGRPDGGTDDFRLLISNGSARTVRGVSDRPPLPVLTVQLDGVDFLKLISGSLDPMRGYFGGQIDLAGDLMFAAKLGGMFRMPKPRAA